MTWMMTCADVDDVADWTMVTAPACDPGAAHTHAPVRTSHAATPPPLVPPTARSPDRFPTVASAQPRRTSSREPQRGETHRRVVVAGGVSVFAKKTP